MVAFLIKNQGVSPHARDKEGFTALHNACSKGFLDIVRFLVSGVTALAQSRHHLTSRAESLMCYFLSHASFFSVLQLLGGLV